MSNSRSGKLMGLETVSVMQDSAVITTPMPPDASIVVPAWNEAENLPLLVPRVAEAMQGRIWEMVIVDDGSLDGTVKACQELCGTFPVKLVVRNPPLHGLSGAVLDGIAATTGRTIVVMDADLQHPPEEIPALIEALDQGADFALGSRYVPGGSTDAEWTLFRKINSGVATAFARPFAGPVRDPMSGFFAIRRETFNRAERLTPLGYKIALELMCKCRVTRVKEIPIHFGRRTLGESKLNLKQQFRYLEHLSRLYDFTFPRASPILKFLVAVMLGFMMGTAIFAISRTLAVGVAGSIIAGYFAATAVTMIFHIRYVRTQRRFLFTPRPWQDFFVISLSECLAVAVVAEWLVRHAPLTPAVEMFIISFACGIVVRYILRKELLHDIRGLRRDLRAEELT